MATFNPGEILAANATDADVAAMREWLKDCGEWQNMEDADFDALRRDQVVRAVNRYYFGGLAQFYKDGTVAQEVR